jgi:cyclopropane-fatty-acyl-phospholipid synthase
MTTATPSDAATVTSSGVAPNKPLPRTRAERTVESLLARADVRVNGDRPWDLVVRDDRLFRRLVVHGLVGLGDAYVDGWWECAALDEFFHRALRAGLPARLRFVGPRVLLECARHAVLNLQTRAAARANSRSHYELGNDLFVAMLDAPTLAYTCGYWRGGATTLEEAQVAKADLICRKLGLRPGQRVLDVGCGWGGFARFAAERYGASVVGVTLSDEQLAHARRWCAGLPVELRKQDYRDVPAADGPASYDHVATVGMLEHVGPKNYRAYARVVRHVLKPDGLLLLHTIGAPRSWPNAADGELAWIQRHIFPGGVLPSVAQVGAAVDGLFVLEDVENFGPDYDPTLLAWFANFDRNWPGFAARYGERFYRTWKYYLLSCAGGFRARKYQLWQFVLSPRGVTGGYARPSLLTAG